MFFLGTDTAAIFLEEKQNSTKVIISCMREQKIDSLIGFNEKEAEEKEKECVPWHLG